MARRGQNEGSIYQRADGRWAAAVSVGRGKRDTFYGKTRGEVQRKLTAALKNQDEGLPASTSKQRVADYLTAWLETVEGSGKIRPKTFSTYSMYVRLHIIPELGRLALDELGPQHVEQLMAKKLAEGLAAQSVVHVRGILRRALGRAVKHQLLIRNVAALADPPHVARTEMRPLDPAQARTFLELAQGDRLEALWVLAITSGLREGELLGLQWRDVDLEAGTVAVNRSLQRFGGKLQLVEPKTEKSRRRNPIPRMTVEALRSHRSRQVAAGRPPLPTGFVFTSTTGTPLEPRNMVRLFKSLLRRAGLPDVRFHDLRHSAASLLIAQGVPLRTVMEVLGHSTITLTANTYGHLYEEAKRDAADAMDRMLGAQA